MKGSAPLSYFFYFFLVYRKIVKNTHARETRVLLPAMLTWARGIYRWDCGTAQ